MNLDKFVDRSEEKVNKYVDKVVNLKQKNIEEENLKHILLCGDKNYVK